MNDNDDNNRCNNRYDETVKYEYICMNRKKIQLKLKIN